MEEKPELENRDSWAPERRAAQRLRISLPAEFHVIGDTATCRVSTLDISENGCYIAMTFTLPVGTELEVTLQLGEAQVTFFSRVVTCDPQVGNGVSFLEMRQRDRDCLREYLASCVPTNSSAELPIVEPFLM